MRSNLWVIAAAVAFVLAWEAFDRPGVRADSVIDLVYLGGPDCPYCRRWEAIELPRLRQRPEFRHIRFTHVPKAIAEPVPKQPSRLPGYLVPMYGEMVKQTRGRGGSPQFILLLDGKALDGGFGTQAYHDLMPLVTELVERKRALAGSS